MEETPVPIPDIPGYYVDTRGTVYSTRTRIGQGRGRGTLPSTNGKMRKKGVTVSQYGYEVVVLRVEGKFKRFLVHTLVLRTFVGPKPPGMETRHLNGNRRDNRLENLAYGTGSENQADRVLHGTDSRGEKSTQAKLTEAQVLEIRELGKTLSPSELEKMYPVSRSNIRRIINRTMWKHI